MKNTLKYLFAMAMAAAGTSAYAASGVIELEIPGMNKEIAASRILKDNVELYRFFKVTVEVK